MHPLFLILTLTGGIFLLAGYIQYRFPPKKINHFYGYRTASSMKSQESWDFAQRFSAEKMMRMSSYIITLGLLSWLFDIEQFWGIGIALMIIVIGPLLLLLQVENELKKRFPQK